MVISFLGYLYKHRRKSLPPPPKGYDPLAVEKRKNVSAVESVVEAHSDCTAEVINVFVKGRRAVKKFRLLTPGDVVRLDVREDNVALYVYDDFICPLVLPDSSRIPQLLKVGAQIEAYLGGRDITQLYNDDADFASIIVFYKIDGLSPTDVNLK